MRRPFAALGLAALLLGALLLSGGTAPASPAFQIPAQVTSVNFTYLPPEITLRQGERLNYINVDIALHNVTSLATNAKGPLFTSDTIAAGEGTEVRGVHDLEPGVYDYTCTLHTFMTGSLNITD
jgi:plastocyanin